MSLNDFLNDLFDNHVEERVIQYMVREIRNGKTLREVLSDPYVKNRINVEKILGDPRVSEELLLKIQESFDNL